MTANATTNLRNGEPMDSSLPRELTSNNLKCPNCGSEDTVRVTYGYPPPRIPCDLFLPDESSEFGFNKREFYERYVEHGGCVVYEDSPTHHCLKCGKYFGNRLSELSVVHNRERQILDHTRGGGHSPLPEPPGRD